MLTFASNTYINDTYEFSTHSRRAQLSHPVPFGHHPVPFYGGFAHSILDVLNKYFQDTLHLSKTESAFIQVVVYGGYFLMALPAGAFIRRYGYRAGVLLGLILFGIGALLFIPGAQIMTFPFFLGCLLHHRVRTHLP